MKKLIFMATIALCSVPTMESSFFVRGAGKAFEALRNNKLNTLCIGGVGYQILAENTNEAKINGLTEELIKCHAQNELFAQNMTSAQNNCISATRLAQNDFVSKTTFWTVATVLGFSCYIAIRAAYHNMLLHRPQINAIVQSASNVPDAIAQLKKYDYKKQDFVNAKATLPKKFAPADIAVIEAQLS